MKNLDKETALAIAFANMRRKKRPDDLVTVGKAYEYLTKVYGSQEAVANTVGLSTEMVRQFLTVLKLPQEVQRLFSNRQIDSVDVAKELAALREPAKQVAAAKLIADSLSKDVRDIKRLVKVTNARIKDAKKIISDAKPKGLHMFIIDLDDMMYRAIIAAAKAMKTRPAELVKGIIMDWIKQQIK